MKNGDFVKKIAPNSSHYVGMSCGANSVMDSSACYSWHVQRIWESIYNLFFSLTQQCGKTIMCRDFEPTAGLSNINSK